MTTTSVAAPPLLADRIKENDPAPYSGILLSEPEFRHLLKQEKCCEIYSEEVVKAYECPEPLIGNPYLFWGTVITGVIAAGVIGYSVGNK